MDAHRGGDYMKCGRLSGEIFCAVAPGCSDWIGQDGGGAVGFGVVEFGGDDQGVLRVWSCGASARKCVFVEVAGGGKLIVGELNGVQLRAHGGDGLAAIRLHADVDIVPLDRASMVDSKFQGACPRAVARSNTGRNPWKSSRKNTPVRSSVIQRRVLAYS